MSEQPRGKRVTIDLTPAAVDEVDRLRETTGLTTADLFRYGLSLLRLYVEAKERRQGLATIDVDRDNAVTTRIEMPFSVRALPTKPEVKETVDGR